MTPEALLESALRHVRLLNRFDFDDICISVKSSDTALTIDSYRLLGRETDYPLHLGVTEAGTEYMGIVKSAVGIGTLLAEGIGDTLRVSLTAPPEREVKAGLAILRALGLRRAGPELISCPTCGRCRIDLIGIANEVEKRLEGIGRDMPVAVMGCAVNGPGEARRADFGIAGGDGEGVLFKKGEIVGKAPMDRLVDELFKLIDKNENATRQSKGSYPLNEHDYVPFYDSFPAAAKWARCQKYFENHILSKRRSKKVKRAMKLTLLLPEPVAPVDIAAVEDGIRAEFGLASVAVAPVYPKSRSTGGKTVIKKAENTVLLGRDIRASVTPMDKVTLELGSVAVRGEVFDVQTREISKRNPWVLSFDMTDFTNSLRVSKFMPEANAGAIAARIKKGMYLTVSGKLGINRYDGELTLEPVNIVLAERETRRDTSDVKRVELHLHTKMSAMDAVADVSDVVRRAADWGHPAVAITDHGVAQAFPDAMKAAGDKIKVIYGMEGYYINDVDDRLAVFGDCAGGFDGEVVVFDIEMTGLSSMRDAITEIGAVVMKDGREAARFQTFADPGMHIPTAITQLTGISDADVRGAPTQEEAVRAFLDFAGGRILAAHNASFDIGFIYEACLRHGIGFEPRYIDTLAAARALLPSLKSHRLNIVADFFSLPEFKHHRASDDAVTAGLVLTKLFEKLRENGLRDISEINAFVGSLRAGLKGRHRPKHIILLTATQAGIKNCTS